MKWHEKSFKALTFMNLHCWKGNLKNKKTSISKYKQNGFLCTLCRKEFAYQSCTSTLCRHLSVKEVGANVQVSYINVAAKDDKVTSTSKQHHQSIIYRGSRFRNKMCEDERDVKQGVALTGDD